jgi:hypothetical protein
LKHQTLKTFAGDLPLLVGPSADVLDVDVGEWLSHFCCTEAKLPGLTTTAVRVLFATHVRDLHARGHISDQAYITMTHSQEHSLRIAFNHYEQQRSNTSSSALEQGEAYIAVALTSATTTTTLAPATTTQVATPITSASATPPAPAIPAAATTTTTRRVAFSAAEDKALLEGVKTFGKGKWVEILRASQAFAPHRVGTSLKDRFRFLNK